MFFRTSCTRPNCQTQDVASRPWANCPHLGNAEALRRRASNRASVVLVGRADATGYAESLTAIRMICCGPLFRATARELRGPTMSNNDFERWVREYNREVERVNRENKRRIDDYNRQVDRENRRRVDEYNRQARRQNEEVQRRVDKANRDNQRELDAYNRHVTSVNQHNRQVDAAQKTTIADLAQRLNATRYSPQEEQLAARIAEVIAAHDPRQWDVFLSYARIDGSDVGRELRSQLEALGVRVWFDEVAIQPGKSQARQMDQGLAKALCGIALLTPAYIAGRFWTERELGALLSKNTLIPVLHEVTFDEVKEYSGILPDLAGFETARHSVAEIADKIADAVLRKSSLPGGS